MYPSRYSARMDVIADNHEPVATAESPLPRRRRYRWLRNILLAIVGTIFAVWLVLFITKGRFLKHPFESIAGGLTERKITVGGDFQLYFAPFRIKFYAEHLDIANPHWASGPSLLAADTLDARIAPLSLLAGRRHLYSLDLTNGAVDLEWDKAHDRNTWTFGDPNVHGKPLQFPTIDQANVTGTTLHYGDPKMPLVADLKIDPITSTAGKIGQAVSVSGTGRVRTTPFRVDARLLSPDATVNRGKNEIALRAWAANNVIDVSGTLPSIAAIEGVPLDVHATGRNLAELLHIIGVAIPQTRHYVLRGQMVEDGDTYKFTQMRGTFGDSDLAGTLTVTNGARLRLDADLTTRQLDIVDASPFLGYDPDIVASKGAVAAAAATGAAPSRIIPNTALPIETMRQFDASLDWKVHVVKSRNVPISNVSLKLTLNHGRLAASPLKFSMARGDLTSDIVFDTRQRPSADSYDIRLSPTPMGRLLAGYGVVEAGTTGTIKGRIKLDGRGDTIHDSLASASGRIAFVIPKGTLWARNAQLSELDIGTFAQKMFEGKLKDPVALNCGLIAFTARDGIAATDPILIDTSKNVITGKGGFSFRDEAIDLAFRAKGKKFSLFSLQSPVGINGSFAKPELNVLSSALFARVGAAAGISLVATPVAGLLAFVDIGDAKGAACGPVLAGANAAAQETNKGKPRKDVGNGHTDVK
jgi:uncharacterized protein involved in outer membrane biogenesis